MSRFFDETFSSYSAKKVCRGTRLRFRNFWVSKNCMHKRGKSQMSIENMLSHSIEKFHKGILLFLNNFWFRKVLWMKRGITFFRRTFLVWEFRKNSWPSFQCFRKYGVSKNFMHNREYHNFPSKNVCFIEPKNFVKEPISVSLVSGIKKCWG